MTPITHSPITSENKHPMIPGLPLSCPQCRQLLTPSEVDVLHCPSDSLEFKLNKQGIWEFLLPQQQKLLDAFTRDYTLIRHQEGRYSEDPAFYRNLPFKDMTQKFTDQWRVRKKSFLRLLKDIIHPLIKVAKNPLTILDSGAGNGWLSYQLSLLGCQMIACDVSADKLDGLGALEGYASNIPIVKIQADFEHWPLPEQSVDMVIFNASFHYCANAQQTLIEAKRILKPDGLIIILDTPIYHDPKSGKIMLEEKQQYFIEKFNLTGALAPNIGFITYHQLNEWGGLLNINWKIIKPFYSLSWHLRPFLARLRNQREPASFHLCIGTLPA